MTIDEYAEFEKANGADVVNVDGIWWRKVRSFYYQPLFPLTVIEPRPVKLSFKTALGGYKHMVPHEHMGNSRMNYFVWDDVHAYSLDALNRKDRWNVRSGMKSITIKPVIDRDEFKTSGHKAYLSFYSRTGYNFKSERTQKEHFNAWADMLFSHPKIKVLGAYHEGNLCAVDISYLVEDVLIEATFFSDTDYFKYKVSDIMVHVFRESAAACPEVNFIYKGHVTGNKGVDGFKLMRGCKIISKPSYYRINPVAHYVIKNFMAKEYGKLTGALTGDVMPNEKAHAADGQ